MVVGDRATYLGLLTVNEVGRFRIVRCPFWSDVSKLFTISLLQVSRNVRNRNRAENSTALTLDLSFTIQALTVPSLKF